MLFPPALWPLRDEREALPFPHTATSTVSVPCPARGARLHPVALHCTLNEAPALLGVCLSARSASQQPAAREGSHSACSVPCISAPLLPVSGSHCCGPLVLLPSSRLCSCKPRLVDTLQLPLRLTQRMCSDLSCAACARPCSCCHPSTDPCRTRHPRLDSAPAVEVVLHLCGLWAPCSLRAALQLKGPLTHARVLRVIDSACARGALGTRSGDLQQRMQASMCHLLQKSRSKRGPNCGSGGGQPLSATPTLWVGEFTR